MTQQFFEIIQNRPLTQSVYEMKLQGNTADITAAGQFVNLRIDGFYLRRPISVCDWEDNVLTLVYKVVGEGTAAMANMQIGQCIDILTGLGNGFDLDKSGNVPLLVGGGVGTPPMYGLCRRVVAQGKSPTVVLGFATKDEVFYEKEFAALGVKTVITTADGSYGIRGFVTDALDDISYTYTYACGPIPMLHALSDVTTTSGEFSFEERMGCGFGACMGCTCKTKYKNKRICRDGPVLVKEEIVW